MGKKTPTTPDIKINAFSTVHASKIIVENLTQKEQFTPAFNKASKLLLEGISEDYPLTIQIKYGTPNEFIPSDGTTDLLAITTTNFVVNSSSITVGEDPYSSMAMIVTKVGTTLKYQFKLDTEYVTNLAINSATIYDTNGDFKMSVNAGVNQTFSIASLASGYYILKVDVANSTIFSKIFFR